MKKGYELVAMESERPYSVELSESPSLNQRKSANIGHGCHMSCMIKGSAHEFGCAPFFNSVHDIPLV